MSQWVKKSPGTAPRNSVGLLGRDANHADAVLNCYRRAKLLRESLKSLKHTASHLRRWRRGSAASRDGPSSILAEVRGIEAHLHELPVFEAARGQECFQIVVKFVHSRAWNRGGVGDLWRRPTMVEETRHTVEYLFSLVDLDASEVVDAVSDNGVRPVVDHLMRQLDQEVRRVMVLTVRLKHERVLMAVDRDDEEVRQLLTDSDALENTFKIGRVHLVREVARMSADRECGLKEVQPPRRLVGCDRRDRNANLRTAGINGIADLLQSLHVLGGNHVVRCHV